MKYTAQQINQLSWQEWNALMAKELNAAGFRTKTFTGERWEKTGLYDVNDDPELLFVVRKVRFAVARGQFAAL